MPLIALVLGPGSQNTRSLLSLSFGVSQLLKQIQLGFLFRLFSELSIGLCHEIVTGGFLGGQLGDFLQLDDSSFKVPGLNQCPAQVAMGLSKAGLLLNRLVQVWKSLVILSFGEIDVSQLPRGQVIFRVNPQFFAKLLFRLVKIPSLPIDIAKSVMQLWHVRPFGNVYWKRRDLDKAEEQFRKELRID